MIIKPRTIAPPSDTDALSALAFNKSRLPRGAPEKGSLQAHNIAEGMHPGARLTPLPESQSTGIHLDIQKLLETFPLPPLPTGNPFILKDWQEEDIIKLVSWNRVGVFLPVGAGKTVIATLVGLAYGSDIYVVVLPPILVRQWVRWLNAVGNTGGAVAYQGSPAKRHALELQKYRWWVMSYGIFKNDFKRLLSLTVHRKMTLIVDEAQAIKNSGTDLWKKCNTFSLGQNLIMMTGTELNSPSDAYGYVKIKTPTIYRSYGHFEQVHVGKRDFFENPVEWVNLDLMQENLYLQSAQRTKEEIHKHLPQANYIPFPYELDPAHKRLYDELMERQVLELESGGKIDATTAQTLYTYAQQLVLNLNKFTGNPDARPAAFDLIDSLVDQLGFDKPGGPNKFLVWTWFKDSTRTVAEYLDKLFPGRVGMAYGESNSQKEAERFENDPRYAWLVAQPLSAGAGWNPQYVCYNSLFLEVPTRTIPFRQAAGRVDREGQVENANIWIAQAEDTIQTFLYNNLLSNDELVQRVQGNPQHLRAIIQGRL